MRKGREKSKILKEENGGEKRGKKGAREMQEMRKRGEEEASEARGGTQEGG